MQTNMINTLSLHAALPISKHLAAATENYERHGHANSPAASHYFWTEEQFAAALEKKKKKRGGGRDGAVGSTKENLRKQITMPRRIPATDWKKKINNEETDT